MHATESIVKYRFTVDDFRKLGEAGIFEENERIELIEGELLKMAPIGQQHLGAVVWLNKIFNAAVGEQGLVSVQNPIQLDIYSEPQPDIAILRPRDDFYTTGKPTAGDVLLVIEVAETTARYDREIKVPLYARHGIPEVWLIDLPNERWEVYRQPDKDGYRQMLRPERGEQISPVMLPEITIDLGKFFIIR